MTGVQLRVVLAVVVCAFASAAALSTVSGAAGVSRANPSGCGQGPIWVQGASLIDGAQEQLPSCFSNASSQAEAVLSVANNRRYAQLITVSGASLDLAESSFHGSLETTLARLLANSGSPDGPAAFLLGPGDSATLALDRPAPGPAQIVHIGPAPSNAFAVGALVWELLNSASKRVRPSLDVQGCIASALTGALTGPPAPERALLRIHACVNATSGRPRRVLRGLAGRVLRDRFFRQVIHREGTEPHPSRIAYTVPASNPNLANPAIQLGPASLGVVPVGRRTVRHLTASGGAPPYRFYLVQEPGAPGVPSWTHLAADGTLMIEPPAGTTSVAVAVEVVDSNGEHSVVFN
jgi:hypothetical protein